MAPPLTLQTAFHPLCGRRAGQYLASRPNAAGRMHYKAYCGLHSEQARRKDLDNIFAQQVPPVSDTRISVAFRLAHIRRKLLLPYWAVSWYHQQTKKNTRKLMKHSLNRAAHGLCLLLRTVLRPEKIHPLLAAAGAGRL